MESGWDINEDGPIGAMCDCDVEWEGITVNAATRVMLEYSILFLTDGQTFDSKPVWTGKELREYWLDDIARYSEDYDRPYYALVATPAIETTINWRYIAKKLPEHAVIED